MFKASILITLISLTHPTEQEKNHFYQTMNTCDEYGGHLVQVLKNMEIQCQLPDRMDSQYVNDKGDFTGNVYEMWLPEKRNP